MNKLNEFYDEYKQYCLDEFDDDNASIEADGSVAIACTYLGGHNEWDMQVSYNPITEKLLTELGSMDDEYVFSEDLPIDKAYEYLDFGQCICHSIDLLATKGVIICD